MDDDEFLGEAATGAMYLRNGRLVMKRTKLCLICTRPFIAERGGRRGRWPEKCTACLAPPPPPPKACEHCGEEFNPASGRGRPRKYCTEKCRRAADDARVTARPRAPRAPRPTKMHGCVICGTSFAARRNEKVCGDECREEKQQRHRGTLRARRASVTTPCVVCGDPVRLKTKYCKKQKCQREKNRRKHATYIAKPEVKKRLSEQAKARRPPPVPRTPKPPPTPEELERRKSKAAEQSRAYRQRHPQKAKESAKRWKNANPDKAKNIRRKTRAKLIATNTRRINEAKGDHCAKCGKPKPPRLLHFHHVDPATKFKNVSQMKAMTWERIEAEIAKCVVWCADCHNAHHTEEKRREKGQLQIA